MRENFDTEKIFIGVSNVLTWTRTVLDAVTYKNINY